MNPEEPRPFRTEVLLSGPARHPKQMLATQTYDGHASVHDSRTADRLGLAGAPIEGPTHFSQFDPLAWALWGRSWFEQGCISVHFANMAVEGDAIAASMRANGASAHIRAEKNDGVLVLSGTASAGPSEVETEVDRRLNAIRDPGDLFILDALTVGDRRSTTAVIHSEEPNGPLYPFSLREKVSQMTEPSPWYVHEGLATSPWRCPILPMELISVLAFKEGTGFPVRRPAVALFLDLEVQLLDGPVLADTHYRIEHEVIAITSSRRIESYWTRADVAMPDADHPVASVLLHTGFFKASYPSYPPDRLSE